MTASPAVLDLKAGQSADVELTVTRTDAAVNTWTHGSMSWTTAKGKAVPTVTSPVTVKAKSATVTSAVEGSGATGSADVEITPGVTGELTPQVLGLGKVSAARGTATASNTIVGSSLIATEVTVEQGAESLVTSIKAGSPDADWDLYVITPAGKQVSMATASGSESLTISAPAPGTYTVVGHLYSAPSGKDTGTLETLQLRQDAGNLTVTPNPVPVTAGQDLSLIHI